MWQCVIQFITMVTQNTAVQENQIYITTIEYTQNKEKKAELKKLTYIHTVHVSIMYIHTLLLQLYMNSINLYTEIFSKRG